MRFKPRPLEGTPEGLRNISPETLILDGQQRLTSLYQALRGTEAAYTKDSRGKPIRRWYYADMKKAIIDDDDREDAILSIPEDRLRCDDFWGFFAARAEDLLVRIEEAISKPVTREAGLFASDVKVDDEQDEQEDWEDEDLPDMDGDLLPAAAS